MDAIAAYKGECVRTGKRNDEHDRQIPVKPEYKGAYRDHRFNTTTTPDDRQTGGVIQHRPFHGAYRHQCALRPSARPDTGRNNIAGILVINKNSSGLDYRAARYGLLDCKHHKSPHIPVWLFHGCAVHAVCRINDSYMCCLIQNVRALMVVDNPTDFRLNFSNDIWLKRFVTNSGEKVCCRSSSSVGNLQGRFSAVCGTS